MPLKIYCRCGESTEYTLNKPVFCAACGTKFESSISLANQKPKKIIKSQVIETEDEEEVIGPIKVHPLFGQRKSKKQKLEINNEDFDDLDDGEFLPDINALELDIPISNKKEKGVTLGQVIKEQKTGFAREKPKKVNKKKELEEFRLSAGLGGRKDISIESPEDKND